MTARASCLRRANGREMLRAIMSGGSNDAGDAWIGRTLGGRYKVLRQLGEGGIGCVYVAEHLALGRHVALKVLHERFASMPSLRQRFEREARALSRLAHPHVVTVIDCGTSEDSLFLVMELVDGETLGERLRREPPNVRGALEIMRQILRALAYAHGLGIVHRDLKPGNVLVRRLPDGVDHVTVLDFGLAKFLDEESSAALTRQGAVLGTPAYMAPEQAMGEAATAPADVYAATLILFELLTGRRPFTGQSAGEILKAHLLSPIPRVSDVRPDLGVSAELEAFVRRGLDKKAGGRFADAREMLEALDAIPELVGRESAPRRGGSMAHAPVEATVSVDSLAANPGAADPASFVLGAPAEPPSFVLGAAPAPSFVTVPMPLQPAQAAQPGQHAPRPSAPQPMGPGPMQWPAQPAQPALAPTGTGGSAQAFGTPAYGQPPLPTIATNPSSTSSYVGPAFTHGVQAAVASAAARRPRAVAAAAGAALLVVILVGILVVVKVIDALSPSPVAQGTPPAIVPIVAPAPPSSVALAPGRVPPRNLWTDTVPAELKSIYSQIESGVNPSRGAIQVLYRYGAAHRDDARGFLLLGHTYTNRGWETDAMEAYRDAYARDPSSRGDPRMLQDLLGMAAVERYHTRASSYVVAWFGREALPLLESKMAQLQDPEARARLEQLRNTIMSSP